jgi:hypothetical protein
MDANAQEEVVGSPIAEVVQIVLHKRAILNLYKFKNYINLKSI